MKLQALLAKLAALQQLLALRRTMSLHQECLKLLGTDVTPRDLIPDDVACAETVSTIIRRVVPDFPIIPGTYTLWRQLENDSRFRRVTVPMPGTIIISPTGTAKKLEGTPSNGHTGFFDQGANIMSNRSRDGKFLVTQLS